MNTEITKELRARIFGLYIGADVTYAHTGEKSYTIKGVDDMFCFVQEKVGNVRTCYFIEQCKLLLTKPENITDADAVAAFDLIGGPVSSENSKVVIVKNWISWNQLDYDLADLLRSKSYGINYMGINLFDAGIAIEKTQTLTGDGTGHALPPIESHPPDEQQTDDGRPDDMTKTDWLKGRKNNNPFAFCRISFSHKVIVEII